MNNLIFPTLTDIIPTLVFSVAIVIFFVLLYFLLRRGDRDNTTNKLDEIYLKIKEDIKFAVAPKFMELSLGVNDLVDLAIEVWRIEQRIIKAFSVLPENQKKGLENSIQKLKRYLEKYDIEIVDYTNQKFDDGLNLDVLSVEKDSSLAEPIVKETIEPTIIRKGQVVHKAKIIVLSK